MTAVIPFLIWLALIMALIKAVDRRLTWTESFYGALFVSCVVVLLVAASYI